MLRVVILYANLNPRLAVRCVALYVHLTFGCCFLRLSWRVFGMPYSLQHFKDALLKRFIM